MRLRYVVSEISKKYEKARDGEWRQRHNEKNNVKFVIGAKNFIREKVLVFKFTNEEIMKHPMACGDASVKI